ncbi:MAG: hypothetical protein A2Y33_13805 [Spirochaetes bacterium GWF1_51_8]|nr:MAG: hypothetical protein A2Y33_13805 [Spirochaetes bacterium GWF1_51_8]
MLLKNLFLASLLALFVLNACGGNVIKDDNLAGKIKPPKFFCSLSGQTNLIDTTAAFSLHVFYTNFSMLIVEFTNMNYKPMPELSDTFIISPNRFILNDRDLLNTNSVYYFYFSSFYSQVSWLSVKMIDTNGNEIGSTNFTLYWLPKSWETSQEFGVIADKAEVRLGQNQPVETLSLSSSLRLTAYLQTLHPSAATMNISIVAENVSNGIQTAAAVFNNVQIAGMRAQVNWDMTNTGLPIGEYYVYLKFDVFDGYGNLLGDYGLYWNDPRGILAVTETNNLTVVIEPEPAPEPIVQTETNLAPAPYTSVLVVGNNGEIETVASDIHPDVLGLFTSAVSNAYSVNAMIVLESLADGTRTVMTQINGLMLNKGVVLYAWKFVPKNIGIGGYYVLAQYDVYDSEMGYIGRYESYWNDLMSHCKVVSLYEKKLPEQEPEPQPVKIETASEFKLVLKVENNEWIYDLASEGSARVNTLFQTLDTNAVSANISLYAVGKASGKEILISGIKGLEFFGGRVQFGWNITPAQIKEKGEFYILVRYEILDKDKKIAAKLEKYWNEKSSFILN